MESFDSYCKKMRVILLYNSATLEELLLPGLDSNECEQIVIVSQSCTGMHVSTWLYATREDRMPHLELLPFILLSDSVQTRRFFEMELLSNIGHLSRT